MVLRPDPGVHRCGPRPPSRIGQVELASQQISEADHLEAGGVYQELIEQRQPQIARALHQLAHLLQTFKLPVSLSSSQVQPSTSKDQPLPRRRHGAGPDRTKQAESQSRTLFQLGNLADIYFSDVVVLCEGKTDRRLLHLAYELIYGHAPENDHIAFISLGSCADIPKALPVLRAMEIKTRAVADLDFSYTHARSGGLLCKQGQDLIEVKALLALLNQVHGFTLNGSGLPQTQKKGGWAAEEVWSIVAKDARGGTIAKHTHERLKEKGVWIWPNGSIEQVTGCENKGENAILEQEEQLRNMSAAQIDTTLPSLRECLEWILT